MRSRMSLAGSVVGLITIGGPAFAASNTLHIIQSGDGNQAIVHQSGTSTAIGAGNDIATQTAPAKQVGNDNYFNYSNAGYGGGSDNDIAVFKQLGSANWFQVFDSNGSTATRINSAIQDGNNNQVAIYRKGEVGSVVDQLVIDGSHNTVYVTQGPIYRSAPVNSYGPAGGYNTISLVKIVGDYNGYPSPTSHALYSPGIRITQTGSAAGGGLHNRVDEATVFGSNNPVAGYGTAISIYQEGSYNGWASASARIKGSGSKISVSEIGDWNNFDVRQGVSSASVGNFASISQSGDHNSAIASQFGDFNKLVVTQLGHDNFALATFSGDFNGNGTLTGVAAALLPTNTNLVEGQIYQESLGGGGNETTYDVDGSNNLFAMAQIGSGNTIKGTVGSDGNQAAVLQMGNGNNTTFTQTGGANNAISVSQ